MSDSPCTLVGNCTRDPELRYLPSGVALTTFGLAVNHRYKKGDAWESETSFFDVKCWRELAENVAESIVKGTRVLVSGRLAVESWEKDGETKSKVVLNADECGPSLKWATCEVVKIERRGPNE